MRLLSERENTDVVGATMIATEDSAWKIKKLAVIAILDSLCNLIKE